MIAGKSLLQRTYENALLSSRLDQVIVATDDKRIFQHVKDFGGEVVMTAADCPTGSDRMAALIQKERAYDWARIIVNIQGDEPCVDPALFSKLVFALENNPDAVMSTSITPSEEGVRCVVNLKGEVLYFSRAPIPGSKPGAPKMAPSYRHVGIYAFRRAFLEIYGLLPPTPLQLTEDLEQLKALEHGYIIQTVVTDEPTLEVNQPEDLQKIENYLCKHPTSL